MTAWPAWPAEAWAKGGRAALEAAFISVVRRKMLAAGRSHTEVDESLAKAGTLTLLGALVLFDDREKGSEVMARLNRFGGWAGDAFKGCKEGTHQEFAGDIQLLIKDTERLTERVQAL
ncbi:MAG: hypothetical protein Q8O42_22145 [Acidobacteriota bacterium]|nr:hypothetical protein [Acidobacteriota bacterium]